MVLPLLAALAFGVCLLIRPPMSTFREVDFRRIVQSLLLVLRRLEDQGGDGPEHLLHVDVVLGGSLEKLDSHLVCKSSGIFGQDHLQGCSG